MKVSCQLLLLCFLYEEQKQVTLHAGRQLHKVFFVIQSVCANHSRPTYFENNGQLNQGVISLLLRSLCKCCANYYSHRFSPVTTLSKSILSYSFSANSIAYVFVAITKAHPFIISTRSKVAIFWHEH